MKLRVIRLPLRVQKTGNNEIVMKVHETASNKVAVKSAEDR